MTMFGNGLGDARSEQAVGVHRVSSRCGQALDELPVVVDEPRVRLRVRSRCRHAMSDDPQRRLLDIYKRTGAVDKVEKDSPVNPPTIPETPR